MVFGHSLMWSGLQPAHIFSRAHMNEVRVLFSCCVLRRALAMMSVGWNRARCGFPCGRSCWLSGTMEVFQPLSPTPVAPHAQEASRRSAQYRTCCSSVPICIDHGPTTSSVSILMYVLEHSICSRPSSSSSQGRVSYHSVRSRARRHSRPDTPSRPHIRPYQTAPRPTPT